MDDGYEEISEESSPVVARHEMARVRVVGNEGSCDGSSEKEFEIRDSERRVLHPRQALTEPLYDELVMADR